MFKIGVPKETKDHEYRVGLTPDSVKEIMKLGNHKVLVETDAGLGSGFTNQMYLDSGATIVCDHNSVFTDADLIVKIKEPQKSERSLLHKDQILFTYLHLAPDLEQTEDLLKSGVTAIAYETITSSSGGLPLLTPMSEIAGRLAPQIGARFLEKSQGGSGVLLGGVPGVASGRVTVIGGGVSGTNAALIAVGMGADVTVFDKSPDALKRISSMLPSVQTLYATESNLENVVKDTDLLIGAVLIPGATSPRPITRKMISTMKPGSVIVDISIDQGGCTETSRPTSHSVPTYIEEGVTHYCVTNMPGAVSRTSTLALNNVTLPYVIRILKDGLDNYLREDLHFRNGLNIHNGGIYCPAVAYAQNKSLVQI